MLNGFAKLFDQVLVIAKANMKSRYRKTIAGFVWVVLNPIIMFGAQSIAFKKILKLNIDNFYLFLLGGLIPWIFITQTLDMTTPILQSNGTLLKSFRINPLIIIFSQIIDNLFNFIVAFLLLFVPIWLYFGTFSWAVLFLPIAIILMFIGVSAACSFLSVLQLFYKDIKFVINFITGVMFFFTPIFYPVSYIPEQYRFLVNFNPFHILIDPIRGSFYNYSFDNLMMSFMREIALVIVLLILSRWNWNRRRNELYLNL